MKKEESKISAPTPLDYATPINPAAHSRSAFGLSVYGSVIGFAGLVAILIAPSGTVFSLVLIITGISLYIAGVVVNLLRRKNEPEE